MIPPCTNIQNLKILKKCIEELESDLETVSLWSSNDRLVFSEDKTKLMLYSTTQISQIHNLNNNELFKVMHNSEPIERVNTKKIWGIHFNENLPQSYHVNNVIQSSYVTLRRLRQFKRFTPYKVRKSLAKTLLISKIRYFLVVYSQLPKYQIHRLQKTQNRVASYVLGRYFKEDDLIKTLSWLPVTELMDFSIANCCFSALHDPNLPKYLPIKLQE